MPNEIQNFTNDAKKKLKKKMRNKIQNFKKDAKTRPRQTTYTKDAK
jgi:hypothetical protein